MAANEIEQDAIVHGMEDAPPAPDAFDVAIAEYNDTTSQPPEPQSVDEYFAQSRALGFTDDEARTIMPAELKTREELSKERGVLHDHYTRGLAHLQQVAEQASRERDRMDFDRLVDTLRRDFPDMSQPHLETLLVGLHATNERMAQAWSSRYHNAHSWAGMVERIKSSLAAETARPIDRDATETRAQITAAVMRGGVPARRNDAMPNLNQLSDAEFDRFPRANFGFGAPR